eukprot:scaffold24480_cov157-Cylindrotheca_fusiformis.AAC.1
MGHPRFEYGRQRHSPVEDSRQATACTVCSKSSPIPNSSPETGWYTLPPSNERNHHNQNQSAAERHCEAKPETLKDLRKQLDQDGQLTVGDAKGPKTEELPSFSEQHTSTKTDGPQAVSPDQKKTKMAKQNGEPFENWADREHMTVELTSGQIPTIASERVAMGERPETAHTGTKAGEQATD